MNKQINYLEEAKTQVKFANEEDIQADYYSEQGEPVAAERHSRLMAYHTNQASMLALIAIADELHRLNDNLGGLAW